VFNATQVRRIVLLARRVPPKRRRIGLHLSPRGQVVFGWASAALSLLSVLPAPRWPPRANVLVSSGLVGPGLHNTNRYYSVEGQPIVVSPLRATLVDNRPSCRDAILDAIARLQRPRARPSSRGATSSPRCAPPTRPLNGRRSTAPYGGWPAGNPAVRTTTSGTSAATAHNCARDQRGRPRRAAVVVASRSASALCCRRQPGSADRTASSDDRHLSARSRAGARRAQS
jgi:hypothetical protein